jgi:hypothetical protein
MMDSQNQKLSVDDEEQQVKSKNKWHIFLITAIAVLSLVIIANVILAVFIVSRKPSEPKEAILSHPSGEMLICGAISQDLEQAMKLSKELTKSLISESLKGSHSGDFEQARENIAEDAYPIEELLASGRIIRVPSGTSCLILESRSLMKKVQITQGLAKGQTYWVYKESVANPKKPTTGGYIAVGIWVYARYLIAAFICCLGIYFLRIKSFSLQVMFFIVGFIIVNIILNRIIMFFM